MENEFDKEIDVLLRGLDGAAKISVSENEHLDADEIAAFAENAVPQNARLRYITHFADCDSCRETLKNFAELENEFQSQTVQNESVVANVIGAKTVAKTSFLDWFKLPILTYATAALTVLIIGTIALFAIRQGSENAQTSVASVEKMNQVTTTSNTSTTIYNESLSESKNEVNSSVAQTSTSSSAMSNSSASMSNSASARNSNVAANITQKPPSKVDDSDKAKAAKDADKSDMPSSKSSETAQNTPQNLDSTNALVKPSTSNDDSVQSENDYLNEAQIAQNQQMPQVPQPRRSATTLSPSARKTQTDQAEKKKREENEVEVTTANRSDVTSNGALGAIAGRNVNKNRTISPAKVVATKQVNGKTFRRENNVWVDSNYKGGGTTNIIRGSDEYKKLDANVRSIAESLGGEVVVVANGKAFRIR